MDIGRRGLTKTNYVPVLKSKQGEIWALQRASTRNTVPLLELISFPRNPETYSGVWPKSQGMIWVQGVNTLGTDEDAFAAQFESLMTHARQTTDAVPVFAFGDSSEMASTVQRLTDNANREMVLRIDAEDIVDNDQVTSQDLIDAVSNCGSSISSCHLVVDAGLVGGESYIKAAVAEKALLSILPLDEWLSVVVAFSGFPENLETAVKEGITPFERTDALAYRSLDQARIGREVTFGDYGIGTPGYSVVPFAPTPNIKYARDHDWMVIRGFSNRRELTSQYESLAKRLLAQDWYCGPDFSEGDRFWHQVATGEAASPGNATTAVRAGVSHHLAFVDARLSTLGEP